MNASLLAQQSKPTKRRGRPVKRSSKLTLSLADASDFVDDRLRNDREGGLTDLVQGVRDVLAAGQEWLASPGRSESTGTAITHLVNSGSVLCAGRAWSRNRVGVYWWPKKKKKKGEDKKRHDEESATLLLLFPGRNSRPQPPGSSFPGVSSPAELGAAAAAVSLALGGIPKFPNCDVAPDPPRPRCSS
jgi:hypothetical protein